MTADDIEVTHVTALEWDQALTNSLDALGLTWGQLAEQAKTGDFTSLKARELWLMAGGQGPNQAGAELARWRARAEYAEDAAQVNRERANQFRQERDGLKAAIGRVRAELDGLDGGTGLAVELELLDPPDLTVVRHVTSRVRAALDDAPETPGRDRVYEIPDEDVTAAPESSADAPAKPTHIGGRANAEDCPACAGTNPPYPFICPGEPEGERNEYVTCSECGSEPPGDYPVAHKPSCSRMTIAPHLWPSPDASTVTS